MNPATPPLVCDLTTLTDHQRTYLIAVSAEVFGAAGEVRVVPNGFALAYRDTSAELISKIAEFIPTTGCCSAALRARATGGWCCEHGADCAHHQPPAKRIWL